ncbi:unnamed protein product, partial [Lampetra fluviatilis]
GARQRICRDCAFAVSPSTEVNVRFGAKARDARGAVNSERSLRTPPRERAKLSPDFGNR